MIVSYYPGCTLKTHARELDRCARGVAEVLGVELREIPEWQCCGGCYTSANDEIATKLASVRALKAAQKEGGVLVTVCSACYNVLKRVENDVRTDAAFRETVNRYMAPEEPYEGGVKVLHFAELLREIGLDKIREKAVRPLTGRKVAAYYGCLLLRPSKVLAFDDPENPSLLENILRAIGAEPVIWPARNECGGAYLSLEDPTVPEKRSRAILESAANHGAEAVTTACPLCLYNLNKNGDGTLPAVYFTQLLAEAFGVE